MSEGHRSIWRMQLEALGHGIASAARQGKDLSKFPGITDKLSELQRAAKAEDPRQTDATTREYLLGIAARDFNRDVLLSQITRATPGPNYKSEKENALRRDLQALQIFGDQLEHQEKIAEETEAHRRAFEKFLNDKSNEIWSQPWPGNTNSPSYDRFDWVPVR